ncbi:glucosaminidase domain-containing protein [Rheinheimera salexigens]|uniref:Flagellar biosynthesis protein FlgJ n=1 Tax=Rheinheimera salexigens TaxID=1628148 RepID=A0A1E7Q6K5_9GAMM|nr:glucosaminidase domain-containing protein [Rheinheimera salexigens]OEY69767.1 flagellar biosynthesis protein FlgJ [Rheinheimera salexigens]
MFIRNVLLGLFWFGFVIALMSPFIQLEPIQQLDSLEEWQQPSRAAVLNKADKKKLLQRLAYTQPLPAKKALPDFTTFTDTVEKKQAFFAYLRPYVKRENARLLSLRTQLLDIIKKHDKGLKITIGEYAFLYSLYDEFRMDVAVSDHESATELLSRVDIIPESLVLMQAANESAWGTSRFALEGFNFFGQWCFREGCGIVPSSRQEGESHEVAKFSSPSASISSYFYNLNTFHTYQALRDIRLRLRQANKPLRGETLAEGLGAYSERGDDYIAEISSMIRYNRKFLEQ